MISSESQPKHRAAGKPVTLLDDILAGVKGAGKRSVGIALTSGLAIVGVAPLASADQVAGTITTGNGSSDLANLRNNLNSDSQVATFKVSSKAKWEIDEVEFEVKELPPPPPPPVATTVRATADNSASRSFARSAPAASTWSGTVSGSSVVEIARSLVGLNYVSGGSSPSTGFDCSGLVGFVYAQMGKSLPRSSGSIRNAGTVVSNPQPGDVISIKGHVGIYTGNGMMVDAGSTRTGVSERSISWMVDQGAVFLRF